MGALRSKFQTNRARVTGQLAVLTLGMLFAVAGFSGAALSWSDEKEEVMRNAKISLSEAIETVQKQHPGYVVEGELEEKDGMYFYEIALISEDGETEVFINPANGLVIGVDQETGLAVKLRSRWEKRLQTLQAASLSLLEAINLACGNKAGLVIEADLRKRHYGHIYQIKLLEGDIEHEYEIALEDGRIVDHDIDD